ncbi:MAG: DNA polymerase IV [Chitinophagales bacterium]|jgi:DNA polymerase IV|nr:DNA polymerase IV [Chitinophagales bacterium]
MPFDRAILHLDLDAFFVSVELLSRPELKGKPLIIGGSSDRGVVSSCSYEARKMGVTSAMPVKSALRLCPEAVVIRGDMESYARHSRLVTQIIAEDAPQFQKASIDEFYVDLSGMDKYFGCWNWAQRLRRRIIEESGLPISAALSVNKTVSKIGTGEAKPNGELLIPAGTEKDFLAPLPIGRMPFVGKETERRLQLRGVHTLGQLAAMDPALLERIFGKHGQQLWERANGIDDSPVESWREQKSISTERTFHEDIGDRQRLLDKLTELSTLLAYDLRHEGKSTACVAVKIRYPDFSTQTRQKTIALTANDSILIETAHELFGQVYDGRRPLRLLGVRFSELNEGSVQTNLFGDTEKETRLLAQLDKIRDKFGSKSVVRSVNSRPKK